EIAGAGVNAQIFQIGEHRELQIFLLRFVQVIRSHQSRIDLPWSMTRMRLLDSANPVARVWMSLPGVKPSFCSTRRVANSMVVPGRLMPTVLPRSSCAEAIDGLAASFHAEGPNVPMIASGSPRAADTAVVDPGAPRISTSPLASAPIAAVPAAM